MQFQVCIKPFKECIQTADVTDICSIADNVEIYSQWRQLGKGYRNSNIE